LAGGRTDFLSKFGKIVTLCSTVTMNNGIDIGAARENRVRCLSGNWLSTRGDAGIGTNCHCRS
jgi:hypothetical protein